MNRIFHLIVFTVLFSIAAWCPQRADAVSAGIMGGGSIYNAGTSGMNALRASGFNTVILWTIHVYYPSGDLVFNSFRICTNGEYIADANFPAELATLKQPPTSVSRIEVCVGSGGGPNDFLAIQKLMNDHGTGTNTMLYRNFKALIEATGADAVGFNDETLYDVATMVNFGRMLTNLNVKITLVPYNNASVWQSVKSQLGSAVDAVYLQCYAGGSGNNPATWNSYFGGLKVSPGLWCKHGTGCTSGDSAATVTTKMNNWKNSPGIPGGWMWLHDDMKKCTANSMADYAFAITQSNYSPVVTTATWDGGGANNAWSNDVNWTGNFAPDPDATLHFAGSTRLTPSNNFAAGTHFDSIYFDSGASAFSLRGNKVTLSGRIQNSSTSPQIIDLPIALDTGVTVWVYTMLNSGDLTVNGVISGEGNLLKSQQAASTTLILAGSNTYTGGTTINAGNLSISSIKDMGAAIPSSLGMPAEGNGTIGMGTASRLIYTGAGDTSDREVELQGSPIKFSQSGTGLLKFTGNFTVNTSGAKVITLEGSGSGTGEVAGVIANPPDSGNTRIIKDGTGTWVLSGTNDYAGTTLINGGTLIVGSDAPSGSAGALGNTTSPVSLGNSTGTNDAELLIGGDFVVERDVTVQSNSTGIAILGGNTAHMSTFSGTISLLKDVQLHAVEGCTVTFSGAINDSGAIEKTGPGTVVLSGSNSYAGLTMISEGTLALSSNGFLNPVSSISLAAGTTLDVSGRISPYVWGNNASLITAGAGTNGGINAAVLKGPPGGTIDLGTRPVIVTYDGTHPALYVTEGTLALSGNIFTVNSLLPLAEGTYTIIRQTGGSVISSGSHAASGTALPAGLTAYISVNGGDVELTIERIAPPAVGFISMTGSNTVLEWPGTSTWFYTLESTTALLPESLWTNLTDYYEVPGSNGTMSTMGTDLPIDPERYFRIKLTQ